MAVELGVLAVVVLIVVGAGLLPKKKAKAVSEDMMQLASKLNEYGLDEVGEFVQKVGQNGLDDARKIARNLYVRLHDSKKRKVLLRGVLDSALDELLSNREERAATIKRIQEKKQATKPEPDPDETEGQSE